MRWNTCTSLSAFSNRVNQLRGQQQLRHSYIQWIHYFAIGDATIELNADDRIPQIERRQVLYKFDKLDMRQLHRDLDPTSHFEPEKSYAISQVMLDWTPI